MVHSPALIANSLHSADPTGSPKKKREEPQKNRSPSWCEDEEANTFERLINLSTSDNHTHTSHKDCQ